jgi:hypothetical protein
MHRCLAIQELDNTVLSRRIATVHRPPATLSALKAAIVAILVQKITIFGQF